MKLADNNDMHKISDELNNGSVRTNDGRSHFQPNHLQTFSE